MADINRVTLVGRLTRDAELKYTPGGTAVCKFSVAVNRYRKSGEQRAEETSFLDVTVWGRTGEAVARYLTKGRQVAVDGELRQSRWEQDGQPRSRIEIIAASVQLVGGRGAEGAQDTPRRAGGHPDAWSGDEGEFTDDIPF